MHPDKSPELDGMNPKFYQEYLEVVVQVTEAYLNIVNNCEMPAGLYSTHIVLIPKKERLQRLGDLRPISLYNVIYKIIAKVLANI